MSMNLYCDQVDLWQTPTWVTYACLMRADGQIGANSKKDMRRALYIYLQWASSVGRTCARTDEEAQEMRDDYTRFQEHQREVLAVIDSPKLNVYYT